MGRRKREFGKCKICGHEGQLSFEHVPPEKAFNNQRYFYQLELNKLIELEDEYFDLTNDEIYKKGYSKKRQGGIGFYSLCEKCNNDTGSWYGSDFVKWAWQGMSILQKAKGRPSLFYPTFFFPLRTIKQIVTMFFSVNPDVFRIAESELVKFVKDKETRFLSKKYRVFCYYNIEGRNRYISYSVLADFNTNNISRLSEITFPPFGFVLTIDSGPPDRRLTEITHFANYRYNDWTDHYQRFTTLPTFLPNLPGDYRTKSEIKKGIDEAKKYKKP